jgi:predicted nucleotidyltransferase component of viral defense system
MTQKEIEHIALQKDILKAIIDKDWVLGHLLNAFYSFEDIKNCFVFKGGTCLKKCYFGDYRFSEDLDFTLLDKVKYADIKELLFRKAELKDIEIVNIEQFVNQQKQQKNRRAWESKLKKNGFANLCPLRLHKTN